MIPRAPYADSTFNTLPSLVARSHVACHMDITYLWSVVIDEYAAVSMHHVSH